MTVRPAIVFTAALFLVWANTMRADDLIRNVHIVDVETGAASEAKDILIGGGIIASISAPSGSAFSGGRELDGKGGYVIPGLWDSHVHVFSSADEHKTAFRLYLLNGITGIRDMGALLPLDEQKRIAAGVEAGSIMGPRIILSGAWIDASPGSWPGMFLANTPEEGRARVKEITKQGWAAAKSYSMLGQDTFLAIADEAKKQNLPLVGHIPESVTLETAIKAGQNGMEHFGRVTTACSTQEAAMIDRVQSALKADDPRSAMIAEMATHNKIVLETWDLRLCNRILAEMARANLHVTPTLIVSDFYVGKRPEANDLKMRTLPSAVRAAWTRPDFRLEAMTDELRALAGQSIALDWKTFKMAHDAGVPILAATDASFANPFIFHGFSLLDELDRYVEAGLSPRQALLTATLAPARFFKLKSQDGPVAVGRRADLVVLKDNPIAGLQTLRTPLAVIANGRILDRAALDDLQRELESEAAR
ncbi:MAG: amidohydrolase family protein [Rhizobiaceae bacterium]